jgi:hypothetical protein
MPPAANRTAFSPQQALRTFILLLAFVIIIGAIWASSAAIFENIRFARGTGQILQFVSMAHALAQRDKNFATQPNEDVFEELSHAGLLTGATDTKPLLLSNPWKGTIRSISAPPGAIRIETDVPDQACRRLGLFFVRNGGDLGLATLEAHRDERQPWQRFYDVADGIMVSNNRIVEDACNQGGNVILALVFKVQ